uniref:Ubiquitin interaction motif containing 1 n=1 Tax=Molossus molossus TaxID=27622 RepID=A0A7J8IDF1_MOLMO|nr:ubiquitin interaction motif containing 1 [Molossus molossus]
MPRKKKKVKEASEAQNLEKKDAETASPVNVKRKRKLEDAFIVISDSDGEEPKEENGLQKMKTKQSNRAKCLGKRKIALLTWRQIEAQSKSDSGTAAPTSLGIEKYVCYVQGALI